MGPIPQLKYTGSTPGADSSTYVLFSTVAAGWPTRAFALFGTRKFVLYIKCVAAFTLKSYTSSDGGTNWRQDSVEAVSAPASTDSVFREYVVEAAPDWKIELTNGGSAQTTFIVSMVLDDQRAAT